MLIFKENLKWYKINPQKHVKTEEVTMQHIRYNILPSIMFYV